MHTLDIVAQEIILQSLRDAEASQAHFKTFPEAQRTQCIEFLT